jgi:HD-GYP domain-containing protein (c-di-GMP phosphodiesterase class II)
MHNCYWLCLQNTYEHRKGNLPSEVNITFLSESDLINSYSPIIIESTELDKTVISKALNCNGQCCVFIENLPINIFTLQLIRFLAKKGIPVFWNLQDVAVFIKNFYAIKQAKTLQELLPIIIDNEKSLHSVNVSDLCYRISIRLMDKNLALKIGIAATFHDIGKLYMPQSFLNAPRWFNELEKQLVQLHVLYGKHILNSLKLNDEEILYLSKNIITQHHERLDGSGYPENKTQDELHLASRISQVADVYDALRSNRPYRSGCDHDLTISYLKAKNGQFDSKIIKTLEEVLHEGKNLWDETQGRHYYCML